MSTLIQSIMSKGEYPPALLLFGEEDFSVIETAELMYAKASSEDVSGMNSDILDGDGLTVDAILTMARSFPMMGDRRVIWVRRFDKVTGGKDRRGNDLMKSYLLDPTPSTVLILTGTYSSLDGITSQLQKSEVTAKRKLAGQKAPLGAILASGYWVEYPRLKEAGARAWLAKRGQAQGITISEEAMALMIARCGTSLRDLTLELDKIVTYIGSQQNIALSDVEAVVGTQKNASIFDLQKAIGKADTPLAYSIVTRMLATERQEMLIIAMLARYFLALFKLVDIAGSTDRGLIAKTCGISPYAIPEYIDAVRTLGVNRIERGIRLLAECDSTLKSSGSDGQIVLQTTIARILEPTVLAAS